MNKDYILNHVSDLDAQQLADAILAGTVTLQELKDTDELDVSKRRKITGILSAGEQEVDNAWEQLDKEDKAALESFINNPKYVKYKRQAEEILAALIRREENYVDEHRKILDRIKMNPNTYSPAEILNFLSSGMLAKSELTNYCGIPSSAIDNLNNIEVVNLDLGNTPESIPEGYTEVYFWGGPGSGKTCALGAVLQMAEYNGCLTIAPGSGCKYATQLKNIFTHDNLANDYLPAPSPVDTTQYLPFTLKLPNEKKTRSVSLIELSGEIFKCFLLKNANQPFPSRSHEETFNSLNTFLKSKNKKLHFFFIDAGRDNRRDAFGFTQGDYLQAAAVYFNSNKLFDKTTDAIYIVLTKSDLLVDENGNHVPADLRIQYAKSYLKNQRYSAFINALKTICIDNSINGGKLTVEPFTLGKVYFQQICNFDGQSAAHIVDILLDRIPGTRKSILDIFNG